MKEVYSTVKDFIEDVHNTISVKDILLELGFVKEEDFKGSKICCPFHKEKTPSMQITDSFFKCYGCEAKGDLIKFIELYKNYTFNEAVLFLVSFLNVQIKDAEISKYIKMQNMMAAQWKKYVEDFKEVSRRNDDEAKQILAVAQRFFPQEVGYDEKNNYVVLPYTSKTGGILAFTKRIVGDERISTLTPKWKHSSMKYSLINSCHNIFNLYRGCKAAKEKNNEYIFVEGPGDVTAMEKAGYLNTIAFCGAENFSDKILNTLDPVQKIYFVMDGDRAGKASTNRHIIVLSTLAPYLLDNTYVVPLRYKEDPGILNKQQIDERMSESIKALEWYVKNNSDFALRKLYNGCKSNITKPKIAMLISRAKNFTMSQTIEWLGYQPSQKQENDEKIFKQRLLATIGLCEDINVQALPYSEEDAKKILKLRFKETY